MEEVGIQKQKGMNIGRRKRLEMSTTRGKKEKPGVAEPLLAMLYSLGFLRVLIERAVSHFRMEIRE